MAIIERFQTHSALIYSKCTTPIGHILNLRLSVHLKASCIWNQIVPCFSFRFPKKLYHEMDELSHLHMQHKTNCQYLLYFISSHSIPERRLGRSTLKRFVESTLKRLGESTLKQLVKSTRKLLGESTLKRLESTLKWLGETTLKGLELKLKRLGCACAKLKMIGGSTKLCESELKRLGVSKLKILGRSSERYRG